MRSLVELFGNTKVPSQPHRTYMLECIDGELVFRQTEVDAAIEAAIAHVVAPTPYPLGAAVLGFRSHKPTRQLRTVAADEVTASIRLQRSVFGYGQRQWMLLYAAWGVRKQACRRVDKGGIRAMSLIMAGSTTTNNYQQRGRHKVSRAQWIRQ